MPRLIASIMNSEVWNCSWRRTSWGRTDGAHGAVAVRAVRDLRPGDERDEAVEEDDPELARARVGLGLAEHARAVGHVDLAREHGLDQARHLLGQVLAVGVDRDDDLGARVGEQAVAGAKRRAAAAVDHVARDRRRRRARPRRRCRRASRRRRRARRSARRRPRSGASRARRRCSRARCRRGRGSRSCRRSARCGRRGGSAPRRGPRARPESSRVTREPWASARTTRTNRIRIAKTATPTMRVPFSRSKEKAERIVSRSSVPETSARPSASPSRIRTSPLRSERRREIAKAASAAASTRPPTRSAVSSSGKSAAVGRPKSTGSAG